MIVGDRGQLTQMTKEEMAAHLATGPAWGDAPFRIQTAVEHMIYMYIYMIRVITSYYSISMWEKITNLNIFFLKRIAHCLRGFSRSCYHTWCRSYGSVLHRNSDDNDETRVALSSHGLHWNLYNNHKLTFQGSWPWDHWERASAQAEIPKQLQGWGMGCKWMGDNAPM